MPPKRKRPDELRRRPPRRAAALVALWSVACLGGCGPAVPPQVVLRPPEVTVSSPVELNVVPTYYFEGYTAAVETVDVRARVNGYLSKIYFVDGADVKQEEPLFLIDPRPYEATYNQAKAEVASVQARVSRITSDLKRAEQLLPKRTISQEEYDRTAGEYAATSAELQAREAALEQADLDRHFCAIKSPIAGRISRTQVTVGNLVTANTTLLSTIVSMQPIYAYFDVDEPTVLQVRKAIREGEITSARDRAATIPVFLGLDIDTDYPYEGKLDFVENRIDPSTGTLKIRGVFPNQDEAISPGLHARIKLPMGKPYKALAISERAIGTNQGRKYVYVVNDKNEVVERDVTLGPLEGSLRVLKTGVQAGERVIVNGLQRVRAGIVVDPKAAEAVASKETSPNEG